MTFLSKSLMINELHMKECRDCHKVKQVSEFYKSDLNWCKDCRKLAQKIRRSNPETRRRIRAYESERYQTQKRKQQALAAQARGRLNYPERTKAYRIVHTALLNGTLIKLPCEVCGNPKTQAHHENYSNPLAIRWLCFKHHREFAHDQIVGSL
jgi:hypothetical protein